MKKIIYTTLSCAMLLCVASTLGRAQNLYDGLHYGENNLTGTARSMALGNAMTAVGGDLGSVVINPAGTAVSGYSTFTISSGWSTGSTVSDFSEHAGSDIFTSSLRDSKTRMTMPNVGFVFNIDNGRRSTLRNLSFGVVANTTNRTLDRMSARGASTSTSMMGAMAAAANGIDGANLSLSNAYDNYVWPTVLAYQSYMISEMNNASGAYLGATEVEMPNGNIDLAGPIDQKYMMQHTGSRTDIAFNFAVNLLDKVYLGLNIGVPALTYNEDTYALEQAQNPDDFSMIMNNERTAWSSGYQKYYLNTTGEGVYLQFGAIVLPFKGLRLGASIKTPTWYSIRERWGYSAQTNFTTLSQSAYSPEGDNSYSLTTPFEYNLGIAYTLGRSLLLSFDYSGVDYKMMSFGSDDEWYDDSYADVNQDIQDYAGTRHQMRLGVEYKIIPSVALRYGFTSTKYHDDVTTSHACGIGYSSKGSFYMDFAARWTKYPHQWYYPYDDYVYNGDTLVARSPEIGYSKKLADFVLTLGFRF